MTTSPWQEQQQEQQQHEERETTTAQEGKGGTSFNESVTKLG
jgi:hypothetical protein